MLDSYKYSTYIGNSPFFAQCDFPELVPDIQYNLIIFPLVVDTNAVLDLDLGILIANFS